MEDGNGRVEFYFNTATQMVEKGRQSSWEHLMGPYASADEAARALETAQARSQNWDEDESWSDD